MLLWGLEHFPLPSQAGFEGSRHQHHHLLSPALGRLGWENGGSQVEESYTRDSCARQQSQMLESEVV